MSNQEPNPQQPPNEKSVATNKTRKKPLNNGRPDKTDQ